MHGWVQEQSIGSGTIIDPDGTILTCAHVVADFQSTKAIVRGKVANLALSYLFILCHPLPAHFLNTVNHLSLVHGDNVKHAFGLFTRTTICVNLADHFLLNFGHHTEGC